MIEFEGADLAPPLRPNQIRDTLLFLQHMQNCRPGQPLEDEWHQTPAFYFGNTTAGTRVSSYLFHVDPVNTTGTFFAGDILLHEEVLGVIYADGGLDASDPLEPTRT